MFFAGLLLSVVALSVGAYIWAEKPDSQSVYHFGIPAIVLFGVAGTILMVWGVA